MKRDLQEISDNIKSPYSLKRNYSSTKFSKNKLNEGLIFVQKSAKTNKCKNFFVKMKKNSLLLLTIGLIIYIYYMYLFVKIIFLILVLYL